MTTDNANLLAEHVHRFRPPTGGDARTLLLLHGTGGDENDLLPIADLLAPTAAVLSPRGRVSEGGAPRFFRRLAEGVFDLDDLRRRTDELAAFVAAGVERYALDAARIVAVGFSNGANIAASLLLSHPGVLAAAVLFRPMVPFVPDAPVALDATPVFIGSGRADPIVPAAQPARLAELLRLCGADVTLVWQDAGHGLTRADLSAAYDWLDATVQSSGAE